MKIKMLDMTGGNITMQDIEDILPKECVDDICQYGDNQKAVDYWLKKLHLKLKKRDCTAMLVDYDINLCQSVGMLRCYVLWIAAWNAFEARV